MFISFIIWGKDIEKTKNKTKNSWIAKQTHRVQFTSAWHEDKEMSFAETGFPKDGYLPTLRSEIQKHSHKCNLVSI